MSSEILFIGRSFKTKAIMFLFVLLLVQPVSRCAAQYDEDYISYDDFYQGLAPYGQWIEDPQFGYVWSPGEDNNFRPYYTNGHWLMTEYGNTWISEYPWGWACFHYGRWTYDEYYGWLWIPGNYWGPAWVSWRVGEGFYGWAPLGPDYRPGTAINEYRCPGDWWVFIPPRYIYSDHYYQYWNGPRDNNKIIKNSRIIINTFENGNYTYFTGPRAAEVRQITGNPVQVFRIHNSKNQNTRVHNDEVRMYRPAEIRPTARVRGQDLVPPSVMVAPKPVKQQPQRVGGNAEQIPPFRKMIIDRKNSEPVTPGTNISQIAEPQKHVPRADNNPYEWDVSRHVKQDYTPEPRPRNSQPAPGRAPSSPRPPARPQAPAKPQQPVRPQAPGRESAPSRPQGETPSSTQQPRPQGRH